MDGEVVLDEGEQLVLLLSCRICDIQTSHWIGLLNAHWKVYPRGRDWLVLYTGVIWVVMALELMFVSIEMAVYVLMLILTTTLMMAVMTTFQTRLACLTIR